MSDTATLHELTREHREGFIDTLQALAPHQWLAPSLCSQWRVLDVAAHLAWAPVTGAGAGAVAMARHGFSMNRMIAGSAVAWSARGQEAILAQLGDNARTGARPIGMPPSPPSPTPWCTDWTCAVRLGCRGACPPSHWPPWLTSRSARRGR